MNSIQCWKFTRIRIRISFGLKISSEYEYEYHYLVSTIRILFEYRIIRSPLRPLTKPAMMTKFLPKILLSWADQWQRQQWRQNSSQRSFWRSLSIIQNVERPLQALSVVSQSFEWCSVPPTWQKLLKMIGAGPKTFCCLLSSTNLTKAVADDWSWSQNVLMFALFHQPPAADLDLPLPPLITSLNVLTDALSHQPVKSSWRWSRLESSITCW